MRCPTCGEYGYTFSGKASRSIKRDGITYRVRRCKNNHVFWTQETVMLTKGVDSALTGDDIVTLLQNERG